MRKRIVFVTLTYVAWIAAMAVQKPVFMAYHSAAAKGCTFVEWLLVIFHGLRHDVAVAAYLTVIPLLGALASVWIPARPIRMALGIYNVVIAVALALVLFTDAALYTFWGFRMDATLLFYLQFPGGAMLSVPALLFIRQTSLSLVYICAVGWAFNKWVMPAFPREKAKDRVHSTVTLILAGAALFIPIRQSSASSISTVGAVYFSENQFLNHSAINPAYSLVSSIFQQFDFASQFQFFDEEKCEGIFNGLLPKPSAEVDTTEAKIELLRTKRPDILLVILESFSANVIEPLGGTEGVTPCLNRLAQEGALFTNMYANSFRTDRGLVSVINGYFAQPTTSIMKYPDKCHSLPSLSKSLAGRGYVSDMLYGGDMSYTNMTSYFRGAGYDSLISEDVFPVDKRRHKWGANDDVTFDYMLGSFLKPLRDGQRFASFLTISSHEPFVVPYRRLKDPYLNSVAFTDSCIGNFIDRLKLTPAWDNLLVIFIADHGYRYPSTLTEYEPARYHIPMLWVGGAVKQPVRIETVASQSDLAATLLSQLDIPHDDFMFSKDILAPRSTEFAFYTFSNGFGFIDSTGASAFDNDSERPVLNKPQTGSEERLNKGKALLQTLYDDLGGR
ncbi:MAG: sulfatase-like hydrolase/transferase [Tannerellaceae bacterium]|jgi:phosphoglycerol transferase MdoB-like AlkP superfamily enzyme|nr:sulfatase-like hydrolase/transferase [Tannerellaceae bacterium]